MKNTSTNSITIKDLKEIDPTQIKSISLLDGNVIFVKNSASSENQQIIEGQSRPLFTRIVDSQTQSQNEYSVQTEGSHKCPRCHKVITSGKGKQSMQSSQANVSQPAEYSQTEDYQNNQYYAQDGGNKNVQVEVEGQEAEGQQNLKNVNGQLLNDMITGKEGMDYYGGEQGVEQGMEQPQEQGEYYNNGEEEYVQPENEYGYEGQELQTDDYYNQQGYDQNVEGMDQGEYYQQGQEGYQEGYQEDMINQENQYQGYEQEQQQGVEQINTDDKQKVTVEEIITMDVKVVDKKEDQKEDQKEEQKEDQKEEQKEDQKEEQKEEQNEEKNVEQKDEQNEEENNVIQNKENQEENPFPEVKDMIEQKENAEQKEEKVEIEEKNEEQPKEENENQENIKEEQPKEENENQENIKEEQPQNQEQQVEENAQNQEEFRESEYKGDEQAEAEVMEESKKNEKKPEKKVQPKVEKHGQNTQLPRPRIPITKISYYEYVIPKRTVNPYQKIPINLLLEQEARRNREQRSHSHSHTYHPTFRTQYFGKMLPGMDVPFFGPRMGIPPRPPKMSPMPPFDMLMPKGFPHVPQPRPPIHHFPHGPQPRPPIHHFPHGPQPRCPIHHFPYGPHGFQPRYFHFPQRPQSSIDSYYSQERRFFGGEGEPFSHIHPHPHPYQRYAFPQPHRRFEEFYENYEPEETFNRTNYFVEKKQKGLEGDDSGYDEESYFTYTMGRPRRNMTTRSFSQGRSNGTFTFNLGNIRPRRMFKRITNRRLGRTTQNVDNTQTGSNTQTRKVYSFQVNKQ